MRKGFYLLFLLGLTFFVTPAVYPQLLGKWVLSTCYSNYDNSVSDQETLLLTFNVNGYTVDTLPVSLAKDSSLKMSLGAFNQNYDLLFYILDDFICYSNQADDWSELNRVRYDNELIKVPGSDDSTYYLVYAGRKPGGYQSEGKKYILRTAFL